MIDGVATEMVEALPFTVEGRILRVELGGGYVFERPIDGSRGTFRILESDNGTPSEDSVN